MVRIPIGNERSSRVEVRSVAPDANPYMVLYSVFKTGIDGDIATMKTCARAHRYLPDNIYDAMDELQQSGVDHQAVWRRREGPLCRP